MCSMIHPPRHQILMKKFLPSIKHVATAKDFIVSMWVDRRDSVVKLSFIPCSSGSSTSKRKKFIHPLRRQRKEVRKVSYILYNIIIYVMYPWYDAFYFGGVNKALGIKEFPRASIVEPFNELYLDNGIKKGFNSCMLNCSLS